MVFYYSGTGNSRWVATQLSEHFSDTLYSIGEYERKESPLAPSFEVKPDEKIGFVFPVYSWGVPPVVTRFIADMQLEGYNHPSVYCIMTCGDECGYTNRMFTRAIKAKGLETKHEIDVNAFDALALPGGFEEYDFYKEAYDERCLDLIRRFKAANKIIASICVGALVLGKSGVLSGKNGTTYNKKPIRHETLRGFGVNVLNQPIVTDDNIITSCCANTIVWPPVPQPMSAMRDWSVRLSIKLKARSVASGLPGP